MDRPYLDANVFYSAARAPTRVRRLWELPETELLTSPYAVAETRRNLEQDKPETLADLDALVAAMLLVAEPPPDLSLPAEVSLPDKDQPVFLSALAAQATHFLTGDKRHFGAYRGQTVGGMRVFTPGDYLDERGM